MNGLNTIQHTNSEMPWFTEKPSTSRRRTCTILNRISTDNSRCEYLLYNWGNHPTPTWDYDDASKYCSSGYAGCEPTTVNQMLENTEAIDI